MRVKPLQTLRKLFCATLGLAGALAASTAPAQTTYTFSGGADFTGPFADVAPDVVSGYQSMIDWWNDTRGKELGVQVNLHTYDNRYDTSAVAKNWPGILNQHSPIAHLGFGTVEAIALMKRLPSDRVPMILGTAALGLVWTPDPWHIYTRPTYSHEFAGIFNYLQQQKGEQLRIGAFSTQDKGGFVDQVNGVKKLAEMYPDRFAVVDVQWVDTSPVSLNDQMRAMSKQNPDVVLVGGTTSQVVTTAKALDNLDMDIPIVSSTHNGLTEVAKGFDLSRMEGSFSVFSFTPPGAEGLKAREVFEQYNEGKGEWGLAAAQSAGQTLLALRALERAIDSEGAGNVTGQAVHDAILAGSYSEEELLGVLPTIEFGSSAPFPVGQLRAKAQVVRDGKIVPLTDEWIEIPELEKWD